LVSRGKKHLIDFTDEERLKLKQCFESLVENEVERGEEQSIGVDELEDPLIALGLVDNR